MRALNSVETHVLAGTEGAENPFWSPDSRFIGFGAQGKLKTIAVSGGSGHRACDVSAGRPWVRARDPGVGRHHSVRAIPVQRPLPRFAIRWTGDGCHHD